MDELSLKHSVLRACDEVGFPEGKKFASGHRSFTDGCSSTDRLSEAACELGQECLYILSNLPKNSPAYKQMKSIMGEVMQCWEDCGSDESSRKEDAMLERIKTLRGKITPIKTAMMNTNANPHAVCIKEMEEMIAGMEYLYAQHQKNPKAYPGYEVLGTMLPRAKAALATLKNVSVYNTAQANELAKTMQGLVRSARDILTSNIFELDGQLFDQIQETANSWSQIAVNARQKPIAEKAMVQEMKDDEVDSLLGFMDQEKSIVAFITLAERRYDAYKSQLKEKEQSLASVRAEIEEIVCQFENGRISEEEAASKIEELEEEERDLASSIENFKFSNQMIEFQYKFAKRIKEMYFTTMQGFSYEQKSYCFKTGSEIGIDLKGCLAAFNSGLTENNFDKIDNAFDTLDLIIEKVTKNAVHIRETIEQRNAQLEEQKRRQAEILAGRTRTGNSNQPQTEGGQQVSEGRRSALNRLHRNKGGATGGDATGGATGGGTTEDPLQETSTNAPQRQQAGSADDFGDDLFGERTERQRN